MPEISDGLRAIIELTSERTAEKTVAKAIEAHILTCPIKVQLDETKNRILGSWVTITFFAGFLAFVLGKFWGLIFK
jgi:hypothetical protein